MLPGMELMGCQNLAVPTEVMHHVVRVESSYNPYAIGVVGGRLVRQPKNLPEALATVRMLEGRGFNFSIGLAQVNRYNLDKYGLDSYERAFEPCANLTAGSKILAECYRRAKGDWGKSFSCYYSGNFSTGFRHGYVQKIYASVRQGREAEADSGVPSIEVVGRAARRTVPVARHPLQSVAPSIDQVQSTAQSAPQKQSAAVAPSRSQPVSSRIVSTDPVAASAPASPVFEALASPRPVTQPSIIQAVATSSIGPIGRAVPTTGASGVANATGVQPAPGDEAPVVKRRSSSPDKALVITDVTDDDAFVF